MDTIHLLQSPGIPWNLDVALIALVYVGIGYFHKDKIKKLLEAEAVRIDVVAGIIAVLMGIFCWVNYRDVSPFYYFDMKPVYYRELICAVPIPCAFDFVLVRTVHWLFNTAALGGFLDFVALCGRATIPIMFMHIPSNHWQSEFNYLTGTSTCSTARTERWICGHWSSVNTARMTISQWNPVSLMTRMQTALDGIRLFRK